MPTDKFVVGDSTSDIIKSQAPNEDLQQMYDRIIGTTGAENANEADGGR